MKKIKYLDKFCLCGIKISLLPLLLSSSLFFASCFVPYGYFETNKLSQCTFLNTKELQIERSCEERKKEKIISLSVDVMYDTIQIINGKASDRYNLFERKGEINFPFSFDSLNIDKSKTTIISFRTSTQNNTLSIHLAKEDWNKELLPFTYYYNK